jgi:WD40 repeat protein
VTAVFFGAAGPRLVTKDGDVLKLWNVESKAQLIDFNVPDARSVKFAVSSDGERIGTRQGLRLTIWRASDGTRISSAQVKAEGSKFAEFNSDLSLLLSVKESTANVWETSTGKLLSSFQIIGGEPSGVAFSADGEHIFTFGADKVGRVWSWRRKGLPDHLDLGCTPDMSVLSATFSLGGEYIITKCGKGLDAKAAELFDAASGQRVPFLPGIQAVKAMILSPDGRLAFSMEGDNGRLRNVATGAVVATLNRPPVGTVQAEFSPGGDLLATRAGETSLEIWEAANGARLGTLTYHTEDADESFLELVGFKFSPDGKRILTLILESDEGQL